MKNIARPLIDGQAIARDAKKDLLPAIRSPERSGGNRRKRMIPPTTRRPNANTAGRI
jgi:hypothetical protein